MGESFPAEDRGALVPGDARARLENSFDLLRREWQDGCRAGNAYFTALGNLRRLRHLAASEQMAGDLEAVIADLERYPSLDLDPRRATLTATAAAVKRLTLHYAVAGEPPYSGRSVPAVEREQPAPLIVHVDQPILSEGSGLRHSSASVIAALYRLSPRQFELHVARVLAANGYREVRVEGGSDDRGVDITCRDNEDRLVAVQCKRFAPTATVSALVVQHLVGMAVKRKAHRAMLVTTGKFTGPARTQGKDYDVELIDGAQLASLIAVHPGLVAALGVGDVPSEEVRAGEHPTPFVPITPDRWPGAKETFKDGSWYHRLLHNYPALTAENMAAVMEWGRKRLCPPTGERCSYDHLLTPRQSRNNCTWRGRCPIGWIRTSSEVLSWEVWIDGRTGKGRMTQKGRPDIT